MVGKGKGRISRRPLGPHLPSQRQNAAIIRRMIVVTRKSIAGIITAPKIETFWCLFDVNLQVATELWPKNDFGIFTIFASSTKVKNIMEQSRGRCRTFCSSLEVHWTTLSEGQTHRVARDAPKIVATRRQ